MFFGEDGKDRKEYQLSKSLVDCNAEELLTILESVMIYINNADYVSDEMVLALLRVEEVKRNDTL